MNFFNSFGFFKNKENRGPERQSASPTGVTQQVRDFLNVSPLSSRRGPFQDSLLWVLNSFLFCQSHVTPPFSLPYFLPASALPQIHIPQMWLVAQQTSNPRPQWSVLVTSWIPSSIPASYTLPQQGLAANKLKGRPTPSPI